MGEAGSALYGASGLRRHKKRPNNMNPVITGTKIGQCPEPWKIRIAGLKPVSECGFAEWFILRSLLDY